MSTGDEAVSQVSDAEKKGEKASRSRYTRDELLAVKEHPDCQKLPHGLEPDDLSDLMESVFFDKNTMFDRSPSSDIYLGPQRGPPPGLRPAGFAGPRRTGFAPAPLHSRLVDDGRSLSPERDRFPRATSSGLASAFAASPSSKTGPVPGGRARFDDASKMDRWDSNKVPGGGVAAATGPGEDDSWTPRGRTGRSGDWRAERPAGGDPSTPSSGTGLGLPRHSLERASNSWGGREAPGLARQGTAGSVKEQGSGRWAKDDPDDWRARKAAGAPPEPRYDWADRSATTADRSVAPREPPPGFGGPAKHRGVPDWADDGADMHRGPVTAADIEAERQRMQAQWKAQREAKKERQEEHAQHEEALRHMQRSSLDEEGESNTFLGEVMDDNDFDAWARQEKAVQEAEDRADEEMKRREAAVPKPGQQIDVKALFGNGATNTATAAGLLAPSAITPTAVHSTAAVGASEKESVALGLDAGEHALRSRFANFFKLDQQGAPGEPDVATGQQPGTGAPPPTSQPLQPQEQQVGGASAGSMLLAMLKKQLPSGAQAPSVPTAVPRQQGQKQGTGGNAAIDAELDDVSKVAMSAALQGLDEAVGEEEGLAKRTRQASPAQQQSAQQTQQALYIQAQHAAMLAALGSRPLQPQHSQQGLPAGMQHGLLQGMQGVMQPQAAGPGYNPGVQPGMQYNPMQYGGMQQVPRPQYGAVPQQQQGQYGGYPGMPPQQQQYRPPVGGVPPQHAALLQQAQQAQQNALLAQLLAAQQRQQAQQAQQMMSGQQVGQINLAALLAAAQRGGGGLPSVPAQALNAAQLMGQPRGVPGMMQPNMGQMQPGPSAQLQFLQQLQLAASQQQQQQQQQHGLGGMPGGAPGMGHPTQGVGQTGGGMTAAQQQQLLGMLRMNAQQRQ